MIDLEQLADAREKATIDKAGPFDFYHKNWNAVIAELRFYRDRVQAIELFHDLKRSKQ